MIAKYNNISLLLGIPGLVIQMAGAVKSNPALFVIGTILLITGFSFYAKAKGRSPAWGLFGLLSWVGILILALLKEKPAQTKQPS
jgi:hypothetical protein